MKYIFQFESALQHQLVRLLQNLFNRTISKIVRCRKPRHKVKPTTTDWNSRLLHARPAGKPRPRMKEWSAAAYASTGTRCVGVTAAVKRKKKWLCSNAACQEKAKKSKSPDVLTLEQNRKALEEEKLRLARELEEEMQFKEEERLMLKDIQDKRILMEQQMRDKEEYERNTRQAEALQNKKDLIQRIKSNQTSFDEAPR